LFQLLLVGFFQMQRIYAPGHFMDDNGAWF